MEQPADNPPVSSRPGGDEQVLGLETADGLEMDTRDAPEYAEELLESDPATELVKRKLEDLTSSSSSSTASSSDKVFGKPDDDEYSTSSHTTPSSEEGAMTEDEGALSAKKLKSALTFVLLTLRNESSGEASSIRIDRSLLCKISDFFHTLVDNLAQESEIILEEEAVYESASFLLEIIMFYRNREEDETKGPPIAVWDKPKAVLATKWLVEDYVDAYAMLAKKHVRKMLKDPIDVCSMKVEGATTWG